MRDYGKIYCAFWEDEMVRGLSDPARLLAAYLLTCRHGNLLGVFRVTDGYAADDQNRSIEWVRKGFQNLSESEFINRSDDGWCTVYRWLKWNPLENPNQVKSAIKLFEAAPDHAKLASAVSINELIPADNVDCLRKDMKEAVSNFRTVLEPFLNPFEIRIRNRSRNRNRKETFPNGNVSGSLPDAAGHADPGQSSEQFAGSLLSDDRTPTLGNPTGVGGIVDPGRGRGPSGGDYIAVVDALNAKTGKSFSPTTKSTRQKIAARWSDGHRLPEFEAVIADRVERWAGDDKMREYLRPETIFGTKFDSYLAEARSPKTADPSHDGRERLRRMMEVENE